MRALPSEPAAPGTSTVVIRLEKKRMGLFSSVQEASIDRVFADPFDASVLLAVSSDPEKGVYGSPDGGRTWTFDPVDSDPPPFYAVLFDRSHRGRAFARAASGLVRTDDAGASWQRCDGFGAPAEAIVLDGAGTLFAAAAGTLHVSDDGCRSWRARRIRVPGAKEDTRFLVRSIAPVDASTIYVSVRPAEPQPAARIASLLDSTSEAALAAFALIDARDEMPKGVAYGAGIVGALVTHDGGETWRPTGLRLDAWLVARDGAVHAVAADPMLDAATLVRRHPELASALARQVGGVRIDAGAIAGSLSYPGRRALLEGPVADAPLYRSVDGGATWSRVLAATGSLAIDLRAAIDAQRAAAGPARFAPAELRPTEQRGPAVAGGGRRRGRGGGGARLQQRGPPRQGPAASSETFLAYLDPARLLAHFNAGRPLTGLASAGPALLAYAPTEEFWNRLARAAAAASDAEGEISLGPEAPPREAPGPNAFELLESDDAGTTWSAIGARIPDRPPHDEPYPEWISGAPALAFLGVSAPGREGVFRRVLRISP